jgi:hemoglobin
MKKLFALALASALVGCGGTPPAPSILLNDGELTVPADYRSWPKFLAEVQRPDVKQVREIWINPVGARARAGDGFANGTLLVMELYAARTNADGSPVAGADGKLVKDRLLKVFIMGKNRGWGEGLPEGQRNGNWIYSAFLADGKTPSGDPIAPCRACHLPLAGQDFVFRVDEYFAARPKMAPSAPKPHYGGGY